MRDDVESRFAAGLFSGDLPPGVTARDPAEAERRFAVYRNNLAHSLTRALAQRFPVIERLVGEAFFAAMAGVFVAAHPPRSPVLLAWGEAFPAFMAGFPPLAGLPYLPDVARLELLRGRAYHAADAVPVPAAMVAAAAARADGLRLGLHPSVHLLSSAWRVVSIWRANQPGAVPGPLVPSGEEHALVLRDAADMVQVLPLAAADAVMAAHLLAQAPLLAAAEAAQAHDPGHDPAGLLMTLLRHGAVVTIREGDV